MPPPLRVQSFLSGILKPSRCNEFESMVSSKCVSEKHTTWYYSDKFDMKFSLFRMLRVLRYSISIVWLELVPFGPGFG